MIDVIATERHFLDHAGPVHAALSAAVRGRVITDPDETQGGSHVLVASYGDHKRARALGYRHIARMEHGAGQSYGGDERTADIGNYPGGQDADDVGLFIVPGPHPASRWRGRYDAPVEAVGLTKTLPVREPGPVTVALSFHYNAFLRCPEGDSAFRWYRSSIAPLAQRFRLIGHAHPRHAARVRPWFERSRVPFVASFDDVCRQADVYACDNSSTIFEFASTGRPVVLLNGPHYRRNVEHGLRFWASSHVGVNAKPATVGEAIAQALEHRPEDIAAREDALEMVYTYGHGGAERAAAAIVDRLGAIAA